MIIWPCNVNRRSRNVVMGLCNVNREMQSVYGTVESEYGTVEFE